MTDPTPALPVLSRAAAAKLRLRAKRGAAKLKLLGDPARVRIVLMLAEGERDVGTLCGELAVSQQGTSYHLAILLTGGAVTRRPEGQQAFYNLTPLGESLAAVARALMTPALAPADADAR